MRTDKRSIGIALVVLVLSIGNYIRLTGTENIRAIHILTLVTIGVAIGVMLVHAFNLIRNRKAD
jgi:hypothetical protein